MRRLHLLLVLALVLTLGVSVMSTSAQSSAFATVTGTNIDLNVRTAPTTTAGIVASLKSGMVVPVFGRLADNSWWQVQLYPSGLIGWVSGQFVTITHPHIVPAIAAPGATPATNATATATAFALNVRVAPDAIHGQIKQTVRWSENYVIVGKTASTTPRWYEIRLPDGSTGWINGNFANIENDGLAPVTWNVPDQVPPTPIPAAFGTVVNCYFLNVRSTPNPFIANVLLVIARNQSYQVIGKNSAGTWWQINVNGVIGWVNGNFLSVTNAHTVPVTF